MEKTTESVDVRYGRLLEGIHLSGYSFQRAREELMWLLEDDRWKELNGGLNDPRTFLDTIDLSPFNIEPDERAEIARVLRDSLGASQRDTAKALGVGQATVSRDLADSDESTQVKESSNGAVQQGGRDSNESGQLDFAPDEPDVTPARPTPPTLITLRTHEGVEVPYPMPKAAATFNQTQGDGISWAKWSWNPVTGCLHSCRYCYAREIATSERTKSAFPAGFTPLFHEERLDAPANTNIPKEHGDDPAWRRVFVCSMADLYGKWVPDEWIGRTHASMLACPKWEYLLLTKFPRRYVGLSLPPNAWVGTSVDEQKRVRLAEDAFRKIEGVKVKWLSLEPLLAPLEFSDLSMFDWVVIGAQTQTNQPDGNVPAFAPPFEWVARITAQAHEAGCKVHLKPNLVNGKPGMEPINEYPV